MSLTSITFYLFFAGLLTVYWITPKKYRWIWLLISSVAFYAFASWKYLFFIGFTGVTAYLAAVYMTGVNRKQKALFDGNAALTPDEKKRIKAKNKKKKKAVLAATALAALTLLVYSKFLNFLIDNLNGIIGWFTSNAMISPVSVIFPLGISFYTFQVIGYLIDVYWGKHAAERNFFKFMLFITFFPKITQGPIIRYKEMEAELFGEHTFDHTVFADGLKRIGFGLLKKIVIADGLGVFVGFAFGNVRGLSGAESFAAVIFYLIQDYCDFSGYMDIAIGLSMCLGVKLPENFRRPYFAASIEEYWRRWHITLGTWFKEYLFYPLSVSKFSLKLGKASKKVFKSFGKFVSAIFGLIIVWLATGFWHGPSWNYALWGLYYGVIIIFSIVFEPINKRIQKALHINTEKLPYKIFKHVRTLLLLIIGRMLFITHSLGDAYRIFVKFFSFAVYGGLSLGSGEYVRHVIIALCAFAIVLIVDIIQECRPQTTFCQKLRRMPIFVRWLLYLGLIFMIAVLGYYGPDIQKTDFGYEQFRVLFFCG